MEIEAIKQELFEMNKELKELLGFHHKDGYKSLELIRSKLKMMIRRIYPNWQEVQKQYFPVPARIYFNDDNLFQEYFISDVNEAIEVINLIETEIKIFGLKDFSPAKKKIENTVGLGKNTWGWLRKTTKEE